MSAPILNVGRNIPFFDQPVGLERQAPGAFVKGRFTDGAKTITTIKAAVHPTSGKDIMLLPEGSRTKESIVVYTRQTLFTLQTGQLNQADRIIWQGSRYQAVSVEDWSRDGGFYRSLCTREGQG